jgi:hypothetical protein
LIGPGGSMTGSDSNGMTAGGMNATGISLNALLDLADPTDNATNVTFVGMGNRVEVIPLSAIRASAGAAIVKMGPGMLVALVPGSEEEHSLLGLTGIIIS